MPDSWQFVAFPLILTWRPEFWSLPLFFPDLTVVVLWQWPQGLPYQSKPLPPDAAGGGQEFRHYTPGELTQWQAYEEYTKTREDVDDILRALRGVPSEPEVPGGPWKEEDAWKVAWRLELMEADQEALLVRVDRGDERLGEVLAPEAWEEPTNFLGTPGEQEIVDPETARLRYLLWRRELKTQLAPKSAPLLLGRASRAIFAALRQEAGGGRAPRVRFHLPGCRSEEEYRAAQQASAAADWPGEFAPLLGACLAAADQEGDLKPSSRELTRWLTTELPRLWPGMPAWTWDLEIWGKEPGIREGGEALLAWGGLGKGVIAS